jgi:hypothetical protein
MNIHLIGHSSSNVEALREKTQKETPWPVLQPSYASTVSNEEVIKTLGLTLTMVEDCFPKLPSNYSDAFAQVLSMKTKYQTINPSPKGSGTPFLRIDSPPSPKILSSSAFA